MNQKRTIVYACVIVALATLACGAPSIVSSPTPVQVVAPTQPPTDTPVATIEPTSTPPATETTAPTEEPPVATPRPKGGGGATIEIINDSTGDIWYLYISPTDADSWGDDWLGEDIIAAGDSYLVTDVPEGEYDLRAEDESEMAIEEAWAFEVSGDVTWTIGGTGGSLELGNFSGKTLTDLYISPSTSDTWGDNWLNGDVIDPGANTTIEDIESGIYDVQVRDDSDTTIQTWYRVDIAPGTFLAIDGRAPLPSNAVKRLDENFDDNRNDWGGYEHDEVKAIDPANGEYCLRVVPAEWNAWEWYEPLRTDAFIAELACSHPESDSSCAIALIVDGDNLYWYEVAAYSQEYALYALVDDEWQEIIDWRTSTVIDPSGYNGLALERDGDMITLFVNGILLEQVENDWLDKGWVGFGGSTYDDADVTFCMDYLRIWELR